MRMRAASAAKSAGLAALTSWSALAIYAFSASHAEAQDPTPSPVPDFVFAKTLEAQERQLAGDALLARFAKSRAKLLAEDPHYPRYHFSSPEHRLNDPNGLSYWRGNWHLFYQGYPPEYPEQHWGHAVSKDLIHWHDLPYAIHPGPEKRVYSGAVLVEDDRAIAMYHGYTIGNMVATSSDPLLLNWTKLTGQPVIRIPDDPQNAPYQVFDPSIWKEGDYYYSLSAGVDEKSYPGRQVPQGHLFRSKDLANWEYLHPFIEGDHFTELGDDLACPYFLPIGDKHIMLFFSHITGGQYFLGDYDTKRQKFVVTDHGKFNHGAYEPSGVHAPSATSDGKGGVIAIFNMNQGKPDNGWDQLMTLPRRLWLAKDGTLRQAPAGDVESLRGAHTEVAPMALPANQEIVLDTISGNTLEIVAEIDPKDAPMVELNLLRSPDAEEVTRLTFYKERGVHQGRNYYYKREPRRLQSVLSLDVGKSSLSPEVRSRPPETADFYLGKQETLKLRIFVDRSVVEVFANNKQVLSVRAYPMRADSIGVSLRAQGQDAELLKFDAFELKSIYP